VPSSRSNRWGGERAVENYLGQLPTPPPGEHGGIPRLREIGDCPKELAFDHSQAAGEGATKQIPEGSPSGKFFHGRSFAG
jgi:hypothetical protein